MYKTIDDELEQQIAYQDYLLHIFDMKDFDMVVMRKHIEELYNKLERDELLNTYIKNILIEKAGELLSDDLELGFFLMYAYDTADIFHPIVQNVIETKDVTKWSLFSNVKT